MSIETELERIEFENRDLTPLNNPDVPRLIAALRLAIDCLGLDEIGCEARKDILKILTGEQK